MDGHRSHVSWEFLNFCLTHNIICLCLPPHSTHILQPLDVGLFAPLQRRYSEELDRWQRRQKGHIDKGIFYRYYLSASLNISEINVTTAFLRKHELQHIHPKLFRQPLLPQAFFLSTPEGFWGLIHMPSLENLRTLLLHLLPLLQPLANLERSPT